MLLAQIINWSLLSLVYPVSLFCYALIQELRPRKIYWQFLIVYTVIVLILKALIRSQIASNAMPKGLIDFSKSYRVGLYTSKDEDLSLSYYIFDVLILLCVVIHIISLILQGLYHRKETQVESLLEASQRIIKSSRSGKISRKNSFDIVTSKNQPDSLMKESKMSTNKFVFHGREAAVSGKNDELKDLLSMKRNPMSSTAYDDIIRKPKQVKPGYDLYFVIAFSQFLIVLFTILFFSMVERDYTNRLPESYTIQQFSQNTIFVIIIMILVISADRHIYLTKKFEIIKENKNIVSEEINELDFGLDEDEFQNSKMTEAMKIVMNQNPEKVLRHSMRSALEANHNSLLFIKEHELVNSNNEIQLKEYESKTRPLRYPIVAKFFLQILMVLLVHFGLFWYFPSSTNYQIQGHYYCDETKDNSSKCNETDKNIFLVIYYLLFWFYFIVSALQLNYGYPELISGNFLMEKETSMTGVGYSIFTAIPFLLEMKVITEWFETKTALGLLQWMKFQIIYGDLFKAKMKLDKDAQKVSKITKLLMGFGGIMAMIIIIAGPMLLFSTLNPSNTINLVTGVQLDLSIEISSYDGTSAVNKYNLFSTNHVNVLKQLDSDSYKELNLTKDIAIRSFDRSLIQEIRLSPTSDANWDITPPSQNELFQKISDNFETGEPPIKIKLETSFMRKEPPGNQVVVNSTEVYIRSQPNYMDILPALRDAVDPSSACDNTKVYSFDIYGMYMPTLFLSSSSDSKTIKVEGLDTNVTISKSCEIVDGYPKNFWMVTQSRFKPNRPIRYADTPDGLFYIPASEKIAPSYLYNYTVIGFYTAIVLVISTFVRSFTRSNTSEIFISNLEQPDTLLLICEGVIIARLEGNIHREKELYYRLIDIMRSPSLIKLITASSLKKQKVD